MHICTTHVCMYAQCMYAMHVCTMHVCICFEMHVLNVIEKLIMICCRQNVDVDLNTHEPAIRVLRMCHNIYRWIFAVYTFDYWYQLSLHSLEPGDLCRECGSKLSIDKKPSSPHSQLDIGTSRCTSRSKALNVRRGGSRLFGLVGVLVVVFSFTLGCYVGTLPSIELLGYMVKPLNGQTYMYLHHKVGRRGCKMLATPAAYILN